MDRRRGITIIAVFFGAFALLSLASWLHWRHGGLGRHPVDDMLVGLERAQPSHYRAVLLSDSVTENAVRGFATRSDIDAILTNGWLRLAGQVMLFQRFLERHTADEAYFFFVPDLLVLDVNDEGEGRIRYTYTDTLFTRRDERELLREAGDRPPAWRGLLFDLLHKSWRTLLRVPAETEYRPLPAAGTRPAEHEIDAAATERIASRRRDLAVDDIPAQNHFFLERLQELCAQRRVRCHVLLEPRPASVQLPASVLGRLRARYPSFGWRDLAQDLQYPDAAFHDGMHLYPDWADHYVAWLQTNVGGFFAEPPLEELPWQGVAAGEAGSGRYLLLEGAHAREAWGVWLRQRAAISVQVPAGTRVLKLYARALTDPARGPQCLSIAIGREQLAACRPLAADQPTVIEVAVPGSSGGRLRLEVRSSYAASPVALGLGADARELAWGLERVAPAR
jgi:hypothetical protein